jgi:hypothetical protein
VKSRLIGFALSLLVVGAVSARGMSVPDDRTITASGSQVKQLAQTAHTPAEFTQLAAYYEVQQKQYSQKAAEQKQEWERRSQTMTGINQKYPRPVDSARHLFEFYTFKASEAKALSTKYTQLAGGPSRANLGRRS